MWAHERKIAIAARKLPKPMCSLLIQAITAPLYKFGLQQKPQAPTQEYKHCLDACPTGFFTKNPFTLAGWFFDKDGRPARQIRSKIGKQTVVCEPCARPDVHAHFSELRPPEHYGFYQDIKIGLGLKLVILEAELQSGKVVELFRRLIWIKPGKAQSNKADAHVDNQEYKHSLDLYPTRFVTKNPFTLAGWFFDKAGQPARQIRVKIGKRTIVCNPSLRPDVREHFSGLQPSDRCGFNQGIKTGMGLKQVILEAEMQSGKTIELFRRLLWAKSWDSPSNKPTMPDYETWLRECERINPPAPPPQNGPLISVLMPVYNTPEKWLRLAIESVRRQTYANWELCIADDASTLPHVRKLLEKYRLADRRIKVVYREKNGHISAASNSALELCTGTFTALFDHDDELALHALSETTALIVANPDVKLIYSDEDKIDIQGRLMAPYFKPDWMPDLLCGQNYLSHLSVYQTDLLRAAQGFRAGYEGSQDWDLALRITEKLKPSQIYHIPKVLYHWRAIPGSTACSVSEKNYTVIAARKALESHLIRTQQAGAKIHEVIGFNWRIQHPLPPSLPLVSIIIPTRDRLELIKACVESIQAKTDYPNYEILIADNDSTDRGTLEWLHSINGKDKITVLKYPGIFNFSKINNFAASKANGSILLFLNNDITTIHPCWLEELVSQACRPSVGCVGAMLYYPNNTVQHGGVILGIGGVANHAFLGNPRNSPGYFNRLRLVQNYSAVTGACLTIRKSIFWEAKGFNGNDLSIAFNDIDLCLKVRQMGYWNVWTPFAELYHHESASRGTEDSTEKQIRFSRETSYMKQVWSNIIKADPAYNPNLTLIGFSFQLAQPPRSILL
jgi:glycosyltransferase involved in cell wall biosynthesis